MTHAEGTSSCQAWHRDFFIPEGQKWLVLLSPLISARPIPTLRHSGLKWVWEGLRLLLTCFALHFALHGNQAKRSKPRTFLHSVKVKVLVTQSCPTLCDPVDYSPPGSSVHGVLQARILR